MAQEIVDFIGKDELLKFHALLAQSRHQLHHFSERHVTIVVTLD